MYSTHHSFRKWHVPTGHFTGPPWRENDIKSPDSRDLTETSIGCYSPPPGSAKSLPLSFYTIDGLPGNLWNYKSKRLNCLTHWTNITPSLQTKHLTALDANDAFWNLFVLDAVPNTHKLNQCWIVYRTHICIARLVNVSQLLTGTAINWNPQINSLKALIRWAHSLESSYIFIRFSYMIIYQFWWKCMYIWAWVSNKPQPTQRWLNSQTNM